MIIANFSINFTEFLAATMWHQVHLDEEHLKYAFNSIDTSGSGKLDAASIKNLVGIDFDDDEVNRLVAETDGHGNGLICYSDFLRSWRTCTTNTNTSPRREQ